MRDVLREKRCKKYYYYSLLQRRHYPLPPAARMAMPCNTAACRQR